MRPDCPVARKADYRVEQVPHRVGAALVRAHHYARGCANTSVCCHGLVRVSDGAVVGAALWMPPTRVCAESVRGADWRAVLSLSRLVVAPGEPQNAATLLIGGGIRLLRRDPRWRSLVTFADEGQGHDGAIYRATNWEYVGRTKPERAWFDAEGKMVAKKASKSRTHAEMAALEYARGAPRAKHKFVIHLVP